MFDSLLNLTGNILKVATAPIEIVADVAAAVTKPIAEFSQDIVRDVKDALDD